MYLESPQNEKVKSWSRLKAKKGRKEQGLYLIEGIRLLEEALASGVRLRALLWDVGKDEIPDNLTQHEQFQGAVYELSPAAFQAVSDTVTSQGVVGIAELPEEKATSAHEWSLLIDGVQDPGNVGTLLRCADAFGVKAVCCGSGTVDPFSPKVVRASMGGMFRVQVLSSDSVQFVSDWKQQFKDGQVVVAAAEGSVPVFGMNLTGPILIVIGSEAAGVSDAVRNTADEQVHIPMSAGTESLNAGVAGSILMYELYRQSLN